MTSRLLSSSVLLPLVVLGVLATSSASQTVFDTPVEYTGSAETGMSGIALGDVNEDGLLDVVTGPEFGSVFMDNAYQVFLGNGDGTLTPFVSIPFLAVACESPHLVDYDGDEHLDLVLGCADSFSSGSITVVPGNGDGTFGSSYDLPGTLFSPRDVALGDLDADGLPDAVVVDPGFSGLIPPGAVVVLSTGPVTSLSLGGAPTCIALGDVTGDGVPDAVAGSSTTDLVTWIGDGAGGFSAPVVTDALGWPIDIVLLDLDGDALLDAVVSDQSADRVETWLAVGDGTFVLGQSLAAGTFVQDFAVGELTGDALDDVVVGTWDTNDLHVLRNNGDGTLTRITSMSNVQDPAGQALGDLDGDGDLDLVTTRQITPFDDELSVLVNRTYLADEPWFDRGNALFGSFGYPIQLCSGTLIPGEPFTFEVKNALPNGIAFLVLGLSELNAPFKLGVMVPDIDVFLKPIFIDANGDILLGGNWGPGLPSGFQFWLQYWFADVGGPAGFGGTNAVRATQP